jgi:hypothetical protein
MSIRFYVQDKSSNKTGPYDFQTIIFKIRSKELKESDKIWTYGMKTYKSIRDIPELTKYLTKEINPIHKKFETHKDNIGIAALIILMLSILSMPVYLICKKTNNTEEQFQAIEDVPQDIVVSKKPLTNDELEIAAFSWVVNTSVEYFAVIPYKVTVKYNSQPELNKTNFKVTVVGNYSNKNANLDKFMNVHTGIMKDEVDQTFDLTIETQKNNVYKVIAITNSDIFNYRKLVRTIEDEAKNLIVGDDYSVPVNLKMTIQNNISPEIRDLYKLFSKERREKYKVKT